MKKFKVYVIGDNGIQLYGMTVTCNEIKKDDTNDSSIYADNVYIDFGMKIYSISEY